MKRVPLSQPIIDGHRCYPVISHREPTLSHYVSLKVDRLFDHQLVSSITTVINHDYRKLHRHCYREILCITCYHSDPFSIGVCHRHNQQGVLVCTALSEAFRKLRSVGELEVWTMAMLHYWLFLECSWLEILIDGKIWQLMIDNGSCFMVDRRVDTEKRLTALS